MNKPAKQRTEESVRAGFGGDTFRRKLVEGSRDRYVCGCFWKRHWRVGDVLTLCDFHRQATIVLMAKEADAKQRAEKALRDNPVSLLTKA